MMSRREAPTDRYAGVGRSASPVDRYAGDRVAVDRCAVDRFAVVRCAGVGRSLRWRWAEKDNNNINNINQQLFRSQQHSER